MTPEDFRKSMVEQWNSGGSSEMPTQIRVEKMQEKIFGKFFGNAYSNQSRENAGKKPTFPQMFFVSGPARSRFRT